ncbi:DUF4278 domain-containing protein [Pleurocapsales cyanobacterium LEGE 06147]|nr:DUF4278 domain-containing protein [Pleurocapsales cyanobacterium LEGE 06147]
MKLKYRGVEYEYKPIAVDVIEDKVGGKYRGLSWKRHVPQIILVPQPSIKLKYRGRTYHKGIVKLATTPVKQLKVPVTQPKMLDSEQNQREQKQLKTSH